jgi:hypothetical protein
MKRVKLISGLGILILVNSFPMMGLAKTIEPSTPKLGGIPTICHQQRLQKIPDLDRQYQMYHRLFERYQSAKQDRLVLQLVHDMDQQKLSQLQAWALMQTAYNHLEAKETEQAIPLLSHASQLLQLKDNSSQPPKRSFPFLDKYNLLKELGGISIFLKQPEQAEIALLQGLEIVKQEPYLSTKSKIDYMVNIAEGLAALGKHEQAIALLDQSLEMGQSLRGHGDWSYLNMLGKLSWEYRMVGQTNKADLLFAQSLQYVTNFNNPVSQAFGLSVMAEAIYMSIPNYELHKLELHKLSMAQNQTQLKRQAKMEQLFAKILQIIKSNQTLALDKSTLTAQWLQFLGIEPAMQIANTVTDPAERFKVLTPILERIRSDRQDLDLSMALLNQAIAIVPDMQSIDDRDAAWSVIATTYAKLNQLPMALNAIAQIQGDNRKQQTLIEVADKLALANQPDQALKLVQGLPKDAVEQVQYDALLAYLNAEQLEPALSIQSSLSKKYRTYSLTELAKVSAKVGHRTQALSLLKQVTESRWQLDGFVSIIQQAIEVGNFDQAVLFAQQMPESTESDIPSKSFLLEEIAIAYAEAGQYNQAQQLAHSLPDQSLSGLFTCAQQSR